MRGRDKLIRDVSGFVFIFPHRKKTVVTMAECSPLTTAREGGAERAMEGGGVGGKRGHRNPPLVVRQRTPSSVLKQVHTI